MTDRDETFERDVLSRVGEGRRAFVKKYVVGAAFAAPVVASFLMANPEGAGATTFSSNSTTSCIPSNSTVCYEYFGPTTAPAFEVHPHSGSASGQLVAPVPGTSGAQTAGVLGTGDVGVYATTTGSGVALGVKGKAQFSTTGQGAIPAGVQSFTVADARVDATTQVVVTLTSNTDGATLAWVQPQPGSGFVIHLTPGQGNLNVPIKFDYYLVGRP